MAEHAFASSAMGLLGLGQLLALVIGIAALLLSAVLGALSWATALKQPETVGKIFGRGFLGVSAVIAFAIGGVGVAMGFELWSSRTPGWVLVTVAVLTMAFMSTEFFIAATLYRRSNAHRPSGAAKALCVASYVLAALFSLATCLVVLAAIIGLVSSPHEGPSAEVRRYQKGCDADVGQDCNMLGLRYRLGDGGLPRDPSKAAEAFRKACDLGTAIGCRNLAELYDKGEGVPKDVELARKFRSRYHELEVGAPATAG